MWAPAGQMGKRAPGPTDIFEHPTRMVLLRLIRERHGLCETELGHLTGLGRNNVKYHLQRLVRAKAVFARANGRKMHYFPREFHMVDLQRAIVGADGNTRRRLLEIVMARPELSWRGISRLLEVTPRAVRWHMQQLIALGLLEVQREGQQSITTVHPTLRAIIEPRPNPIPEAPAALEVTLVPRAATLAGSSERLPELS